MHLHTNTPTESFSKASRQIAFRRHTYVSYTFLTPKNENHQLNSAFFLNMRLTQLGSGQHGVPQYVKYALALNVHTDTRFWK